MWVVHYLDAILKVKLKKKLLKISKMQYVDMEVINGRATQTIDRKTIEVVV